MARKKKLIWFEQEAVVGGADEARQRGASQGAAHYRLRTEPFYGPVTVEVDDDDDPAGPDALRVDIV
jgi:hypothetical protein